MSKKNRKQRIAARGETFEYHAPSWPTDCNIAFENPPSPEYQARIDRNEWDTNLDEVLAFIKEASKEPTYGNGMEIPGNLYWSWAKNIRCKYVSLNFDMRDGAFTLRDGQGHRISLDQLKWQFKPEEDPNA